MNVWRAHSRAYNAIIIMIVKFAIKVGYSKKEVVKKLSVKTNSIF